MAQAVVQFDTHKSVKELIKANIPEEQAEALVTVFSSIVGNADLVTKEGIAKFKEEIFASFATKEDLTEPKGDDKDIRELLKTFATKEDLQNAVDKLEAILTNYVTKDEFFAELLKTRELIMKVDQDARDRDDRNLKWIIGTLIATSMALAALEVFF